MPTYDYQCQSCEHAFEAFQSMSARPLKKCPACGKMQLKRLIGTGAGVIFKGSGFYETDYRSSSYKKAAEADKGGSDSKNDTSKSDAGSNGSGSDSSSGNNSKSESQSDSKPRNQSQPTADA